MADIIPCGFEFQRQRLYNLFQQQKVLEFWVVCQQNGNSVVLVNAFIIVIIIASKFNEMLSHSDDRCPPTLDIQHYYQVDVYMPRLQSYRTTCTNCPEHVYVEICIFHLRYACVQHYFYNKFYHYDQQHYINNSNIKILL